MKTKLSASLFLTLALTLGPGLPLWAGPLTFESATKEVVASFDAATATADFTFKNETADTVILERSETSCPCLKIAIGGGRMIYKPGESGVIRATMDLAALTGTVDKSLAVWVKGDPDKHPSQILTMRAKIPELVSAEPKGALIWMVGEDPVPKTVTLTMLDSRPIKVTTVTTSSPKFTKEIKVIEEGKKYEITVTPTSTEEMANATIRVDTDCTYDRYRKQAIFALVKKPGPKR